MLISYDVDPKFWCQYSICGPANVKFVNDEAFVINATLVVDAECVVPQIAGGECGWSMRVTTRKAAIIR